MGSKGEVFFFSLAVQPRRRSRILSLNHGDSMFKHGGLHAAAKDKSQYESPTLPQSFLLATQSLPLSLDP